MPSMPWIKLYTEMLDDPKLGRLSGYVKWHFVALCLMAGECDSEGYLVNGDCPLTSRDIAWRLRDEEIIGSLDLLSEYGLMAQDDDGSWFVVNFSKRQGRSQSEKRRLWRERKQRQRDTEQDTESCPEDVTRDNCENHAGVTPLEESREEESREEGEKKLAASAAPPPPPEREKPRRRTRTKDPPPPAVECYKSAMELYPAKALWPGIVQVVGEDEGDLERWKRICLAWRAMGWSPKNVKGPLEYFRDKRIPGDDKPKGHQRAGPPTAEQVRAGIRRDIERGLVQS